MKVTLYCYLNGGKISVSGRTKPVDRDDIRYQRLLAQRGLTLKDVQTYMLLENGGKDILYSYMFEKDGWLISANHGKMSVCYGPMSYEESIEETRQISTRLGII